jgi:hypothetical protein
MLSPIRPNTERSFRRAVRTKLVVLTGIAVLVVMNALAVQPAARQAQPGDALTVDASGRVGIGKAPDPSALLDVSGMIKSQELNSGMVKSQELNVGNDALVVKNGNVDIKGPITGGQLLAGAPIKKSDKEGTGQLKINTGHTGFANWNNNSEISNDISSNYGQALMLVGNSSRRIGEAIRWVQAWDNLEVMKDLFVGVQGKTGNLKVNGTATVANDLTVNGRTTINGELPPYTFDIGKKGDTTNWHARQVEGSIIRDYLGDEDGGTIKILIHVNSRDEVRVITEWIYIEQSVKSSDKTSGLSGWTRQDGGPDLAFTLNTPKKNEIIPHPWNWVYVRNYSSGGAAGLPSNESQAWGGDAAYRMEFLSIPDVTAKIIIYDR